MAAKGLWSIKFEANETATVNSYQRLWVIANDVETASRKAKRFLKNDGGRNIVIKIVEQHGTIDAF